MQRRPPLPYDEPAGTSNSTSISPLANPPLSLTVSDGVTLLDELVSFLADSPDGTSEEFVAYLRESRRCSRSLAPIVLYQSADTWRDWIRPDSVQWRLLAFFSRIYTDFADFDLIRLLERWHRLVRLAGPDWEDGVLRRLLERLQQHFSNHTNHKCRQHICTQDIDFLYRHFGIVPSHMNFPEAVNQMICAIEWAAVHFNCLFVRFRDPGSILSNNCRFCRMNAPQHSVEFTTVCALASRRTERHTMEMCDMCSAFVRKFSDQPYCPCCERQITHARHVPL